MTETLKEIEDSVKEVLEDCLHTLQRARLRVDKSEYDHYHIGELMKEIEFILEEPDDS